MVAILILAAGSGSRMGQPKALLEIDGERLVDRAVNTFIKAGHPDIFVVLGAWVGEVPHCTTIINDAWVEGMGSSLIVGLSAIQKNPKYREVIISLVDLPGLTPGVIQAISDHPHDLVIAEYGGKRGHPVKIGRSHWDGVLASSSGDVGARSYLSSRSDVYQIAFDDLEIGRDLDTPADLAAFRHA